VANLTNAVAAANNVKRQRLNGSGGGNSAAAGATRCPSGQQEAAAQAIVEEASGLLDRRDAAGAARVLERAVLQGVVPAADLASVPGTEAAAQQVAAVQQANLAAGGARGTAAAVRAAAEAHVVRIDNGRGGRGGCAPWWRACGSRWAVLVTSVAVLGALVFGAAWWTGRSLNQGAYDLARAPARALGKASGQAVAGMVEGAVTGTVHGLLGVGARAPTPPGLEQLARNGAVHFAQPDSASDAARQQLLRQRPVATAGAGRRPM
jgi:hypothetical protein